MSINLTLGAIVVLLAGLVLNFKSSKERQENGEWSSGLQWSYLLCMVGVFGILSEFMSFTAVLLVFVVFTGIVWAIHKGRLKKSETGEDNAHLGYLCVAQLYCRAVPNSVQLHASGLSQRRFYLGEQILLRYPPADFE